MEFRGWTKQDVQRLRELMQEYGDNMGLMRLRGGTALQGRSPSDIQVMWKALQKKIPTRGSTPQEPSSPFRPSLRKRKASEVRRPSVDELKKLKEPEEETIPPGSEEEEAEIKVPVSPAHSKPNNVKINQVIWISSGSESSSSGSEDASDGYSDSGSNSNNSGSGSESAQVSGSPSASGEESSSSESSCDREEEEVEEVIDLTSRNSDDSDGSVDNKTSSSLNHSSSSSSSSSSSASHDKAAGPDADAISVPDSSDCARSRSRDVRVSSTEEGKEGEGEVVNHSRPSTSENLMNGEENVSSPKTNEEGGCGIAMDSSSPFLSPREKLKQEKEYQESDMEEWKRRQEVIRQQSQRARARRKKIKEENSRIEKRLKELKSEREKGEKELSEANRVRPSIRKKIQNRLNGSTYFPSVARKLGLTSSLDPTFAEMTKVYKKAILKYHPDRINKSFSVIEKVTHEELFKVLQSSFQSYK